MLGCITQLCACKYRNSKALDSLTGVKIRQKDCEADPAEVVGSNVTAYQINELCDRAVKGSSTCCFNYRAKGIRYRKHIFRNATVRLIPY